MVRLCVHCNARPFISLCVHSLVFPERTFYLCTKTGVEADEWIKILRWKLVSVFRLRYGICLPEALHSLHVTGTTLQTNIDNQ